MADLKLVMLFVTAFVTALSGALMPGPVLFATVRWSAERGRWVGPLVVAGHAVVEAPLMVALIFGLGKLLSKDVFVGVVGLAGGAVLLAMGALMLRGLPGLRLPASADGPGTGEGLWSLRVVGAGALTSVSNPYFTLWWATVGLSFMTNAAPFGALGYCVFYAGHIMADLAWYGAVSESVHRGRRLLSDGSYRWLVGVCAVLLVGFAFYFSYKGYRFLTVPVA
ncbi:MAG: LysE family transporter [Candidatus Brocadiae bacterium]|nr:LysE family transporter [Candidatus Brocadiia bacterium]